MDYEKKYKEALEIAKGIYYQCSYKPNVAAIIAETLRRIFPELAESEDERIRKEIIHLIKKSNEQGGYALHKDEADNMIAWLEKQGHEPKKIESQPKQEWSEEDESMLDEAIYLIRREPYCEKDIEPIVDWLKSLKGRVQPQNKWKPSDEQLNNILDVLSFDNCTPKRRELLQSLYEQLKKL